MKSIRLSIFYLFTYLSIYLSIYLSAYQYAFHSIFLNIYLSIFPLIYLSIHLSIFPLIYLSIYLSIFTSSITISIYVSIYLSIDRCIFLSVSIYGMYLPISRVSTLTSIWCFSQQKWSSLLSTYLYFHFHLETNLYNKPMYLLSTCLSFTVYIFHLLSYILVYIHKTIKQIWKWNIIARI